ncbi:WD repeat, SAM and U-box domain-containing protein 1-like isoform X2 [Watersipora subatra]|uniref:WD repeat, SAM and U-box domain-containing protein 1-like isoform X2 n=1 Tax=Watersipora subatra TaxID=2589382 RepID=UPI00355C28F8
MYDSTVVMELRGTLPIHTGDVHCIAVHDDAIATTSASCLIQVFNTRDLSEKSYSPLKLHKYHVIHCVFTSDGQRLVSTSMDGKASIVDIKTGKLLAYHQQKNEIGMRICCLSPNDHLLAVGACDGAIGVVEMDTYKSLKVMSVNDDESILALSFTPDTRWLLSGHSVTGDIRVFNSQYLSTKPVACQLTAHELGTHCLQVSPKYTGESSKGIIFVSGGADCLVVLWSISYDDEGIVTVPRLAKLSTFVGHTGPVYSVKFNHSGDSLASCGGDFTVRLWNLEGECLYVHLAAHTSFINSLAFSGDDTLIYTGSCDRTVKVWSITDTYSLSDVPSAPLIDLGPTEVCAESPQSSSILLTETSSRRAKPNNWSVEDVCHWLNSLGLSKYSQTFRENDIDGYELLRLDSQLLERELHISAFGSRNKLVRGIEQLLSAKDKGDTAAITSVQELDEFVCPITHQVMADPVVASDGYSYERQAIEAWLAAGKLTSPMTNAELPSHTLLPNTVLKILIQKKVQG